MSAIRLPTRVKNKGDSLVFPPAYRMPASFVGALLQGRSELEIQRLFERRERLYALADMRVELDRDGVDAAAREVLARLRATA